MRELHTAHAAAVALALAWAGLTPPASGSIVVPMDLPTLADHAGQVLVGEVVSAESYWAEHPRRIETRLSLARVDYLKGRLPDATDAFTLVVPGGTVGETTMRLADAPAFAVGERWVLFLLPEYRTFPTVGIAQGAFRVATDRDGTARVFDAAHNPVTGVDAEGAVQIAQARAATPADRLVSATSVRVAPAAADPAATALTYDEFVTLIRPVLDRSRDHHLTQPAGRRVLVRYEPRPLVPAPGAAAAATPALRRPAAQPERRPQARDRRAKP